MVRAPSFMEVNLWGRSAEPLIIAGARAGDPDRLRKTCHGFLIPSASRKSILAVCAHVSDETSNCATFRHSGCHPKPAVFIGLMIGRRFPLAGSPGLPG